jgi:serine protease AprX
MKGANMFVSRFVTLALVIVLVTSSFAVAKQAPANGNTILVRERTDVVLADNAMDYINEHAVDGQAKVWVFFTDRGITTKDQLDHLSSSLLNRITDRAMKRRAKVNKDHVTVIDVPVKAEYVDQIVASGAKLRRTSRYLNAASFEVPLSLLTQIEQMPFVAEIRPMIAAKKDYPKAEMYQEGEKFRDELGLGGDDLSYGASFAQLDQINVIAAHNAGYSGAGVLVAMFDTGFRTTHQVFQDAVMSGRLIAEYDFVFDDDDVDNEPEDWSSAWNHGTLTWSTLGGEWDGYHYGPAYGADFILAKTEDIRSETPVEEDNWVAALEWADSIGTDVISSSLSYTDWYTYEDFDGNTATVTIAADLAAEYGIVVSNSAGNSGPGAGTIGAPADADSILSIGAVTSSGSITSFSSRGPTFDGRTKPETCARGSGTACAGSGSDTHLTTASGTSLSCPLIGGVAALVIEAHPDWTAAQVREAIMMTSDNAATPDNTYGWGIANAMDAINYAFDPGFVAGDANGSGMVDIDDAVFIITYIFGGGPEPDPFESGDANGSGDVDLDDVIYIITYIFGGGPPPVAP